MTVRKKVLMINKILVPVDFTPHSESAIRYARMIAKKFKATIVLMHVIEPFTYSVTDTIQVVNHYRALRTIAEPLMVGLERSLKKDRLKVETIVTKGTPYLEIVRRIPKAKVDIIIMGTHGRTGLKHLLMGSVADRVVRLSPCPVITVRGS